MNIQHELKRCKACTDLTERRLADRLTALRIQTEQKLIELGVQDTLRHIDGKSSNTSYTESVKRLRQALSNYVRLEDDTQTLREAAPDISQRKNINSNGNPYIRTQLFLD
ncbi:uncharacterized protein LOC117792880 [Drosophila innubila]|uniref:uncharacterized protein LOC117792880 n=1 Tax=Drosophila innubila TaxID=198719 RepID=UPI00148B4B2C|nr:uncharacterized protein LOC117792880 [Drosophila innubila]